MQLVWRVRKYFSRFCFAVLKNNKKECRMHKTDWTIWLAAILFRVPNWLAFLILLSVESELSYFESETISLQLVKKFILFG